MYYYEEVKIIITFIMEGSCCAGPETVGDKHDVPSLYYIFVIMFLTYDVQSNVLENLAVNVILQSIDIEIMFLKQIHIMPSTVSANCGYWHQS